EPISWRIAHSVWITWMKGIASDQRASATTDIAKEGLMSTFNLSETNKSHIGDASPKIDWPRKRQDP
ncbi:MAG: hypothetical protein IPO14_04500, partial [Saprospiraceae bacterium]|nr:hypothetical protein [Saprospiraceae bacterium]